MNDTLERFATKFNIDLNQKSPIQVHTVTRTEMAKFFHDMQFEIGAELGVAQGWYSEILCKENPQAKLYAIDAWENYDGYQEYFNRISLYEHHARNRLKPYNCQIVKKFSMDAVKDFADNSLDFIFIDGAHDFKNVAMDIYEWAKKVRPGGVVYGHDYKRSNNKYVVEVKDVVQAYMYTKGIRPWFALENTIQDPKFGRDNPCWMFIRKEGDRL